LIDLLAILEYFDSESALNGFVEIPWMMLMISTSDDYSI